MWTLYTSVGCFVLMSSEQGTAKLYGSAVTQAKSWSIHKPDGYIQIVKQDNSVSEQEASRSSPESSLL